ncbi:MAG TPA: DUF655 domain-containing protein [Thermoplasmata archaeon]|nr:DUF655 domain-containing protein [Thermoplasmata archaeon]
MEDYAIVLDYLPDGRKDKPYYKSRPIVLAVGSREFKLFELYPRKDAIIQLGDWVYIGKDKEKRKKIYQVKARVGYDSLTSTAKSELPYILEEIVKKNEERFVEFFNESHALTTRFHMLELLPGFGKKTLQLFLKEQKKGPFLSFEDLEKRVPTLHHPEKVIARRIELELKDPKTKYHLFVRH